MRHDISELFDAVKSEHEASEFSVPVNVQHDGLRPTLRLYQKHAVIWMLHRERYGQEHKTTGSK